MKHSQLINNKAIYKFPIFPLMKNHIDVYIFKTKDSMINYTKGLGLANFIPDFEAVTVSGIKCKQGEGIRVLFNLENINIYMVAHELTHAIISQSKWENSIKDVLKNTDAGEELAHEIGIANKRFWKEFINLTT